MKAWFAWSSRNVRGVAVLLIVSRIRFRPALGCEQRGGVRWSSASVQGEKGRWGAAYDVAVLHAKDENELALDLALGRARERVVAGCAQRAVVDVGREVTNAREDARVQRVLHHAKNWGQLRQPLDTGYSSWLLTRKAR